VISLQKLSKHFGRFAALRSITAEFGLGARFYGVLGDNGAGKSTLLRVLAGLTQPTSGSVLIAGKTPRESRRDLGFMAHASLLYDELDAMENLAYFAQLYGGIGHPQCEHAIRMVGLDPTLKRRVGQYSQGMRQRLSLARAVVHGPSLLLLDEPFSNVDVHSGREMVRLLAEMRDRGLSIFVVTHQPMLLEGVADEFITIAAGQIVSRERSSQTSLSQAPANTEAMSEVRR